MRALRTPSGYHRLLFPEGGITTPATLRIARNEASQQPALALLRPFGLVLRVGQAMRGGAQALDAGTPDSRKPRLTVVHVGVEVGKAAPFRLVVVERRLILLHGQKRLRLRARGAPLFVERRVVSFAADRGDRKILGTPALARQIVEPLLMIRGRDAVVGCDARPVVLAEDAGVENLIAGGITIDLPQAYTLSSSGRCTQPDTASLLGCGARPSEPLPEGGRRH